MQAGGHRKCPVNLRRGAESDMASTFARYIYHSAPTELLWYVLNLHAEKVALRNSETEVGGL